MKYKQIEKIDSKIFSLLLIVGTLLIFQTKVSYCDEGYGKGNNANGLASRLLLQGSYATIKAQCPSIVSIKIKRNGNFNHYCAGALITGKFVVTAASCVQWPNRTDIIMEDILVAIGEVNITQTNPLLVALPVKITKHPQFKIDQSYDIAVIELDQTLTYGVYNKVILNTASVDGISCHICGYGATHEGGQYPTNLRAAFVKVYESVCPIQSKNGVKFQEMSDNYLCSSNSETLKSGACIGDIGDPLYCNGKLSGFISATESIRKGKCGPPDYYVSISHFHDWIIKQLGHITISVKVGN